MNDTKKIGPVISEPTEEEIGATISRVKKKYDVIISRADAAKYAKLTKEFSWWLAMDKESESQNSTTDKEMVAELKSEIEKQRGQELTDNEVGALIKLSRETEKKRIAREMRMILEKYKPVV